MKGTNPTKAEKAYWNELCSTVGCVACLIDSNFNGWCSIHHTDGRTKPGCHKKVLPLCGPHHQQDDTDPYKRIAVHPNKARFEAKYGRQADLIAFCDEILAQAKKKLEAAHA